MAPAARRSRQAFLRLLSLLLLIYATLGKSGSYIGITLGGGVGIYIGDLALLTGLAVLMVEGGYERFFVLPVALPWFFFFIWSAAQTLPYLSEYGLLALRDGAVWGYSLFAVIVASQLMARPSGFVILVNYYKRFASLYVFFVLLVMPTTMFFRGPANAVGFDVDPSRIEAPLGFAPPGLTSLMTHVIGTMAFVVCRFVSVPAAWWWAFAVEFLIIGSQSRGVLMASLAAAGVLWLLNPWSLRPGARGIGLLGGLGFMLAAMLMLNLNLGVGDFRERQIGPGQLLENITGAFSETGNDALDGTREWRMKFWTTIIDYTIFGSYFWTGKGYGINLADDAGLQAADPPTRSPENSHLTLLARSGVPGFSLWVVLQLTWAVCILRVLFFARRTGRRRTTGLMTFLLVYWTYLMVDAATGVLFEGPVGGIWFWAIFGVGVAAAGTVRRDVDFFERTFGAVAPPTRATVSA